MRPKPEISALRPSTSLWSKKASRSCNQRNEATDTERMCRNWGQREGTKRQLAMLGRIEQQFGVPASIIVAIWGLETDFGLLQGRVLQGVRMLGSFPASTFHFRGRGRLAVIAITN